MRLENEELHYRAKFDVYPYATQNPAFPKLCQILWDWVRGKERWRRSELLEALTATAGKDAFAAGGPGLARRVRRRNGHGRDVPEDGNGGERGQAPVGHGVRRAGPEALVQAMAHERGALLRRVRGDQG